MCSAPLHSVCHHLWLLSTLHSHTRCKTLTGRVDGRFEVSVGPSPLAMPCGSREQCDDEQPLSVDAISASVNGALLGQGENECTVAPFQACARRSPLFMLHLLLHLDDILYNCPFYKVMRSYGSDSETTILWNMECVEKHTSPLMKTFLQMFLPFTPLPSKEPGCV